ncbi:non-ribosomal peptide synthetase [Nocardia sp. NPDC004568]|uniref:non-ribosomal peptide synthetase n=1 Tax=Nocardia sp. NPDC004568 TaxID=3154551 RepID=UPI0033B4B898
MLAEFVRCTPEAPAVSGPDAVLDYRSLGAGITKIARELTERGLRAGDLVAISLPPSAAGICAALGVLTAGGILLPLDISQPPLRRADLATRAGVRFIISATESTDPQIAVTSSTPRRFDEGSDAAYVIFTSGSTGHPKGVVCTHDALHNVARAQRTVLDVRPTDRVAQIAPWCVDAFLFEILLAVTAGACLHIATAAERYPGLPLERFLVGSHSTVAVATPSSLRACEPGGIADLRLVISAGEAIEPDLATRWAKGRELVNAYGVTEATIWTTYSVIDEQSLKSADFIPLGNPVPGCSLELLDENLEPVPAGTPGQICIGGTGLAIGYLEDAAADAASFPVRTGDRLFLTGDFGVRLQDGRIRFIGRRDEQVKMSGLRVELGEVGRMLARHPSIRDCVVRRHDDRLVAYLVPDEVDTFDRSAVIAWMEQRLPVQMVPTLYAPMAALPLTAWGKLDHRALPDPDAVMATQRDPKPPQSDPTQAYLGQIVPHLLKVGAVAADDDLFMLGLTSLTMARLLRQIYTDLQVDIEPVDVFENPTLGEIARLIDLRRRSAP